MDNLLSFITFVPAVAALIMALFLRGDDKAAQTNAKWLALFATTATAILSLFLVVKFDPGNTEMQFVEEYSWIAGLKYKMGLDGISILFVLLTTFLMPITILSAWKVDTRVKEYMIAFLMLETLMLGVFCALDLVLFYLFFEAGLIPMFLIIGIWGGKDRIYASFKFFLYTFLGSVLMLVAMVAMYVTAGTTDMVQLLDYKFASDTLHIFGFGIPGGFIIFYLLQIHPLWHYLSAVARPTNRNFADLCAMIVMFSSYVGALETFVLNRADPSWLMAAFAVSGLGLAHNAFIRHGSASRHETQTG